MTADRPDSTNDLDFVPTGDLDVNDEVIVRLALT
jgi:hypothetical protein